MFHCLRNYAKTIVMVKIRSDNLYHDLLIDRK